MRRVGDIRELARILIEAGYQSAFDQNHLPPDLAAIQAVKKCPGSEFIDELGFVPEKDASRLYLRNRIDFEWLATQVQLRPNLKVNEAENEIISDSDYIDICGGTEPPPPGGRLTK